MPATLAILAAGNSSRAGVDKVLADLGGHPVLLWSLQAGEAAGCFGEIVVVAPAEKVAAVTAVVRGREGVRVVAGGATRTASTWAALDAAVDADVIAIHDAARPFVPPSLFQRCVEIARDAGSAVAGLPLADTVRRADEAGASREEIEREGLWAAHRPSRSISSLEAPASSARRTVSASGSPATAEPVSVAISTQRWKRLGGTKGRAAS